MKRLQMLSASLLVTMAAMAQTKTYTNPVIDRSAPVVEGKQNLTLSGLDPAHFESNVEGRATHLYTMRNSKGMEVCITNFGARIVSIMVPDRKGVMHDVVLGFDNIAQYADRVLFASDFGAAIGRYANRINKGQITVDG